MKPVVVGVYGCLGVKLLLCSHECYPGDASVDVEVLLGLWSLLKTSYLVVCVGTIKLGILQQTAEGTCIASMVIK
jgi:hypothetical protein